MCANMNGFLVVKNQLNNMYVECIQWDINILSALVYLQQLFLIHDIVLYTTTFWAAFLICLVPIMAMTYPFYQSLAIWLKYHTFLSHLTGHMKLETWGPLGGYSRRSGSCIHRFSAEYDVCWALSTLSGVNFCLSRVLSPTWLILGPQKQPFTLFHSCQAWLSSLPDTLGNKGFQVRMHLAHTSMT